MIQFYNFKITKEFIIIIIFLVIYLNFPYYLILIYFNFYLISINFKLFYFKLSINFDEFFII